MTTNSIGQRVDYLIHSKLGIKQVDFAKEMNLHNSNVSHIIHDERPVSVKLIKKICNTYGVSADWLLGLQDSVNNYSEYVEVDGVQVCKNCGNEPLRDTKFDMLYFSDYCPFCGKYMRGKERWIKEQRKA